MTTPRAIAEDTENFIQKLTDKFLYDIETTLDGLPTIDNATALPPSVTIQLRLYDIFIPLLGIFIIVFNLAVVISSGLILRKGQQPRSTYLFLGNVALADLVTGIAVLYGQFYPRHLRDENSCAIQIGLIVSSTITSVYSVGLIAVDRFLYILYGLQYQRYIYPNRARLLIAFTWIIGLIIGFLPAMGWRGDTDNGRVCWFILLAPPELVILTTVVGIAPIILVFVLYSIILYHALKKVVELKKAAKSRMGVQSGNLRLFTGRSTNNLSSSSATLDEQPQQRQQQRQQQQMSDPEEPLQQPTRKRFLRFFKRKSSKSKVNLTQNTGKTPSKWKAIKVVLFTTGSFFFTWVPYFIACSIYVHCDPDITPELCNGLRVAIASPLAILGFANSLLNPVIYAWWHNGFRESVRKMYNNLCRKKSQSHNISSAQHSHSHETRTNISESTRSPSGSDTEINEHSDIENINRVHRGNVNYNPDHITQTTIDNNQRNYINNNQINTAAAAVTTTTTATVSAFANNELINRRDNTIS